MPALDCGMTGSSIPWIPACVLGLALSAALNAPVETHGFRHIQDVVACLLSRLRSTSRQIATLTLNRPVMHNAVRRRADPRDHCHVAGSREEGSCARWCWPRTGSSFSAGADLQLDEADGRLHRAMQNLARCRRAGGMLRRLQLFPQPTIAVVQGAAYGGGVGLVAVCDIAIAVGTRQLQPQRGQARP